MEKILLTNTVGPDQTPHHAWVSVGTERGSGGLNKNGRKGELFPLKCKPNNQERQKESP